MTIADTMRLRDRLLAELRASPQPISTPDLAARMPWKVERCEDTCALLCHRRKPNPDVEVLECHRSWHVVQYRRTAHGHTGIYRHLRSLERQGLIRRSSREGRKRVLWIYSGGDQLATAAHGHPADDRGGQQQTRPNGGSGRNQVETK
jgi:hypothetical protein